MLKNKVLNHVEYAVIIRGNLTPERELTREFFREDAIDTARDAGEDFLRIEKIETILVSIPE